MVKVFTTGKDGKISFTKKELEDLLNEVWLDGRNSDHWSWHSPWYYSPTITTTTYPCNTTTTLATQTIENGETKATINIGEV